MRLGADFVWRSSGDWPRARWYTFWWPMITVTGQGSIQCCPTTPMGFARSSCRRRRLGRRDQGHEGVAPATAGGHRGVGLGAVRLCSQRAVHGLRRDILHPIRRRHLWRPFGEQPAGSTTWSRPSKAPRPTAPAIRAVPCHSDRRPTPPFPPTSPPPPPSSAAGNKQTTAAATSSSCASSVCFWPCCPCSTPEPCGLDPTRPRKPRCPHREAQPTGAFPQ